MLQEVTQLNTALYATAFIFVFIMISVVILFTTFNNRKNRLMQENLEATIKNQQRQHELELKALRGQMDPHFVHNSLNAIQYYIQQNDVETSENYLAKFSKLMRQFFEFSRKQSITIKEEVSLLQNYLYIEKLRFEDKLTYTVEVDKKLDVEDTIIPSMILQPLVENAINHGLFHKVGVGSISVLFQYINNDSFRVVVIDDGIGINKAKTLNSSIQKHSESHSSSVIEERLHFYKESNLWDVDFEISDRLATEGINGTKVVLTFNEKDNDKD